MNGWPCAICSHNNDIRIENPNNKIYKVVKKKKNCIVLKLYCINDLASLHNSISYLIELFSGAELKMFLFADFMQ